MSYRQEIVGDTFYWHALYYRQTGKCDKRKSTKSQSLVAFGLQ